MMQTALFHQQEAQHQDVLSNVGSNKAVPALHFSLELPQKCFLLLLKSQTLLLLRLLLHKKQNSNARLQHSSGFKPKLSLPAKKGSVHDDQTIQANKSKRAEVSKQAITQQSMKPTARKD